MGLHRQEEGWVVCRVFKKRIPTMPKVSEHESVCWYDDQVAFMHDLDSPKQSFQPDLGYPFPYSCKKELDFQYQIPHDHFLQLPLLQSPKLLQSVPTLSCNSIDAAYGLDINQTNTFQSSTLTQEDHVQQTHEQRFPTIYGNSSSSHEQAVDQVTDWRVLDKFVASQLSHEDVIKETNHPNASSNIFNTTSVHAANILVRHLNEQEASVQENASTSTSSCQIDLWK
uniref:Transcription factor n=1 Tax=Populus alba TaxID=43335 RepID=A0A4U5Q9V9_POPAL|nr:transcription factor [Populus alba]